MLRFSLVALCALSPLLPTAAQDKKKAAPKTEPRVLLCVPLGMMPGKTAKLTLRGSSLDSAKEVKVQGGTAKILTKGKADVPDKNPDRVGDTQIVIELTPKANLAGDSISIVVVTASGETKPHTVLVSGTIPELEPNDGFPAAQRVNVPVVLEGVIGRPKDVDVFRFEGRKGQKISAEALASRHGSPLDALLTLYDEKGQQLAFNDDFSREHRDAKIEMTLPADGAYYLSLIDAHDSGSNLHVYRLVVK